MRIMTMLLITLFTGAAGIGAWMLVKSELPSVLPGGDAAQEMPKLNRAKWRDAPYVILAPAETLPEKQSTVSPPPPEPAKPKVAATPVASSPAPRPAPITTKAPPKAQPPAAKSSIAKLALETVIGPQTAPLPITKAEPKPKAQPAPKPLPQAAPQKIVPQPVARIAPPPTPAPVKQKTAEKKKEFQLPYEVKTNSQAEAIQKQQSLLAQEQVRFRKAVPLSSGTLKSAKVTIRLAGLDALGAAALCKYVSGKSWECGRWGKYALRRFIRGRSVVCDVIEQTSETEVTARCEVAGVDINNWVVRRGWGRPSGEGSKKYDVALKAAKSDKLGQWSVESAAN